MSPDRLKPPKTVKKPINGNLFKRNQVTGHLTVAVDDGQEMPPTVVINGVEETLTKEKPLPKPKDNGTYWWQQD